MNIVITGASRGIGLELLKHFAASPENTVWAFSRHTDKIRALQLKNVMPLAIDIGTLSTNPISWPAAFKRVDVLINNAGLLLNKPFEQITKAELESVYNVNLFAPFMLIQQLIPFMGGVKRSHIVNISSMGGFQGSLKFAGLSAYSSSKAALAGLSECLAEEFKDKNIAVNCLAIGAVQTEMLAEAFPGYQAPLQPHEMAAYIHDFAIQGHQFFNGKTLPVSLSTP